MQQRPAACRLGAAARLRVFEPIRAGVTALVAWSTRDLIGARHTMGDHVLGELVIGYGWFRGRYTQRQHRADPSPGAAAFSPRKKRMSAAQTNAGHSPTVDA